ncbi:TetR family transcriptional regulator [Actinocorallia herbida]|uniref:TetR family transcriptional regulator n=1 Tax=Actinocorallia herbida TaxID=58109 RepID=A0A3N1D2P5_9ACTN|nr:TetR/AcrR family transcriptional regulator [Actinocorallia herbida]ROO87803.1 TetR family transcriptional regulator [Actinocorallia herbida]
MWIEHAPALCQDHGTGRDEQVGRAERAGRDEVAMEKRGVGRPRAVERAVTGLSPREEVLSAAAELFTVRGYTATTTREVAERAGIRQASMYHYFKGKEAILAELLESTVRPSLEAARALAAADAPAGARLWALCRSDVALLCSGPHNLGALYLLPEADRIEGFAELRAALKHAYADLLAPLTTGLPDRDVRADLVFALVEAVILIRRDRPDADVLAEATADAALRVAGVPEADLPALRTTALALLSDFSSPPI